MSLRGVPPSRLRRARLAASWLVAAALLWSQVLGLWHAVLHPSGGWGAAAHHALHAEHDGHDGHDGCASASGTEFASWLERWLGSHEEGGLECRLIDHATAGDLLGVSAVELAGVPPAAELPGAVHTACAASRPEAVRNRGPPTSRHAA